MAVESKGLWRLNMSSCRFVLLKASIEALRSYLLPEKFEDNGIYADEHRVSTLTLAFRVQSHAEMESYFEDRVEEIATSAWRLWETNCRMSRPALCLMAFCKRERQAPPDTLAPPQPTQAKDWNERLLVEERLRIAVTSFTKYVRNENNGIREKNLMALLLPIGLNPASIDPLLLADIDAFGRKRGEAAHSSTATKVQEGIDPRAEYEAVMSIVDGMNSLDQCLSELLSGALACDPLGLDGLD